MTRISRRSLLVAAGTMSLSTVSRPGRVRAAEPPRKLQREPLGLIEVPPGFSVRVIERMGDPMDDGFRVPGRPDAMACFTGPSGELILMRNHENQRGQASFGPQREGTALPPEAYDQGCYGGVSRIVLDPTTKQRRSSNLVLTGTINNCAGGISPWGWLSCEEWEHEANHGYTFLCDPNASSVQPPRIIRAYGRFRHEAACVDPNTMIAYLTEDQVDSAFYRFVPSDPTNPFEGKLQALALVGMPRFDTGASMPLGELNVEWVDIDDPTPERDSVRHQAHDKGAAFIRRGEGMWLSDGHAYFTATIGGRNELGQILDLNFASEPNTLSVLAESPDKDSLNMPDNLTVSPSGVVYVAEDGPGRNCIRRITPDGRIVDFARNIHSDAEFAGVCFSPDGDTMFVNMQDDHLTLAIQGHFAKDEANDAVPTPPDLEDELDAPLHERDPRKDSAGGSSGAGIAVGGLAALAIAAAIYRRRTTPRQ